MGRKQTYEEEAYQYHREQFRKMMAVRASRQLVIRAGTLAALGGASAINGLLAACAAGSQEPELLQLTEAGQYKYSRYPLVEKYHWRTLPWPTTPYIGGQEISPSSPPQHWNVLRSDLPATNAVSNTLMQIRAGFGANYDINDVGVSDIVERMEHSPDLSTWTFYLKRGVRWHNIPPVNGRELTADDVVYCSEKVRTEALAKESLWMVDKVEALDRYTVRYTLKRPILFFPETLCLATNALFAREHAEGPEEHWNNQPIGTGALQVTYSRFRDRVDAVRNPQYIGRDQHGVQLPYNDKWVWQYIADAAAGLSAFRTGQVDYIHLADVVQLEDILATNPNSVVYVMPRYSHHSIHLLLQWKDPLFQDVRVRRALSMGVDRRKMIEVLYRGAATPSTAIAWDWWGDTDPPTLEELGPYMQYNPTEARRLLAEAGYSSGLTLEQLTTSVTDMYYLLRDMWREIGVELTWREVESTIQTADRQNKRFRHMVVHPSFSIIDLDSWVSHNYIPDSPRNFGSVNDPVMTEMIEKQRYSLDADERKRLAKQMLERAHDQAYHVWLVTGHVIMVRQPWLFNMINTIHLSVDASGRYFHWYAWLDDKAPAGRGGRRAAV